MKNLVNIRLFFFVFAFFLCSIATAGTQKHQGPTGLTIEVPSAGSGGPKDGNEYSSRFHAGQTEYLWIYHSVNNFQLPNKGATMSMYYMGGPFGIFINDNGNTTLLSFFSPTINTDLPDALADMIDSSYLHDFAVTAADSVGEGQDSKAEAFFQFLDAVFHIANSSSTSSSDINHMISTWQAVDSIIQQGL